VTARSGVEALLGVDIDAGLCQLALTHRSFAYESGGTPHNERLEFFGDSVLGQAVTALLYTTFPQLYVGELAKRRSSLVSTQALARIARSINLGPSILLGKGEQQTGGSDKDSILADTMEALIGATFLSAGQAVATDLVERLVEPLMNDEDTFGSHIDPKTSLQEAAAARGLPAPHYSVDFSGPDHARVFVATVSMGDIFGKGTGTSKKHAEIAAAHHAYEQLTA
jgi:ribonuclease-3